MKPAIRAFNQKSLEALRRAKAPGAKPLFTKEQRAKMSTIVPTDPQKLGMQG
jgi:hypothetical protein